MKQIGRALALTVSVAMIASAGPATSREDWVTLQAGRVFSFEAPPSLLKTPARGIDSFAGRYVSERLAVDFDYGQWAPRPDRDIMGNPQSLPAERLERLTVDGREAMVEVLEGNSQCPVAAHLFIVGPTDAQNLAMMACGDAESLDDIQRIFRSVRFAPRSQMGG